MIDLLVTHAEPFLTWLVRITWQAGVLVVLILAIQRVLGRRLGVRGCYGLWLLVLVRLALPWTIPSSASVYNFMPSSPMQKYIVPTMPAKAGSTSALTHPVSSVEIARTVRARSIGTSKFVRTPREQWPTRHRLTTETILLAALVWLGGVCLLAGWTIASGLRLRRIIRRSTPITDRWILEQLEDARRLVGVRARVHLVATDEVDSPALCGLVRPRLLLPRETLAERDRTELRHIFLHELAHLQRHDLLIGHLASILHIVHWFNPLLALGFRRMQADRELACDGLALSRLPPEEAPAYGHTIIHQVERAFLAQPRWVLAGLGGDRAQIKRRVAMIAACTPHRTYQRSLFTLVFLGILAWAGLTDGFVAPATWDQYARRNWPTMYPDWHKNIQRACIRNMDTGQYLVVHGDKVACDADEPGYAGLWEFRFNECSNEAKSDVFFYSVAAQRYLITDKEGNLALGADGPEWAAMWGTVPRPQGVWLISQYYKDGYLRLNEQGRVHAENFGRDARGYWDVHTVWRVKTSNDPSSNPQWQREHVPGPD